MNKPIEMGKLLDSYYYLPPQEGDEEGMIELAIKVRVKAGKPCIICIFAEKEG